MKIFLYFFSTTLACTVGLIISLIVIISPYILPNTVPINYLGLGIFLFVILSVVTLLSFASDFEYFKRRRYEIKGQFIENDSIKADIIRLKDLSLSEIKMNLENIFDEKTPKYIYSKTYLEDNLALVLSLALLIVQTDNDNSDFKRKTNNLTNFLKEYHKKTIYEIDIVTLDKIKKDFNSIIELHFNRNKLEQSECKLLENSNGDNFKIYKLVEKEKN